MKNVYIIGLCLLLVGCNSASREVGQGNQAATGFAILDDGAQLVLGNDTIALSEPLTRLAVTSATHVGMLSALGASECIRAVANPELIYSPLGDDVVNLGDAYSISLEALARADVEAIMVSEGSMTDEQLQRIRQLGIRVMVNSEWREATPLGRAEWIRAIGALVGRLPMADSIYAAVAARYDSIAATATQGAEVMVGNNYRGTWYVPSGQTYMGHLLRDGGARYAYSEDSRTESIPLTVEEVLTRFGTATVWIGAPVRTYAELAQLDEKHTWFEAYKQRHVYHWMQRSTPTDANDFWERGVVHPDEVLSDIVHMVQGDTSCLVYAAPLQ